MTFRSRHILTFVLTLLMVFPALAQQRDLDKKEKEHDRKAAAAKPPKGRFEREREIEEKDQPAKFAEWFLHSRKPKNTTTPPAFLLQKATERKMQMRANHLQALQAKRAAGGKVSGIGDASSIWSPLGPTPIVWGSDATQSWTGRITAIAVDQSDATGNTVLVGGAYGGVWKSTNAVDPTPANIQWSPLMDDQATLSVGSIAIQPGNSNTIIVGSGEPNSALDSYYGLGLFVSNDGGGHWTLVQETADSALQFSGKSISAVAFNSRPGKTNNVVAGVASPGTALGNDDAVRGVAWSSDSGATWHTATIQDGTSVLSGSSVMDVVYNPKEDKFFIVIRYHGVYVSGDQGHTFTRLATQPNNALFSAANCPAATSSGTCPLYRGAMAVRYVKPGTETSATDELYIWLIGFDAGGNTADFNLYQTKNGGTSWTQIDETGAYATVGGDADPSVQSWYNAYLGAVPNGTGTDLYMGSVNIFKCSITSSNPVCTAKPFINLTHVYDSTCNDPLYPNVHPDQHGFDYLGSTPKMVFFGNDGGMYRSLDGTTLTTGDCSKLNVFDSMNADLGSFAQFIWGSQHPTDPSVIMGGTQDNGTMYVDSTLGVPGTAGWNEVHFGDGGYNAIDSVTSGGPRYYASYYDVSIDGCVGNLATCANSGWDPIVYSQNVDNDSSAFYMPYILDPQDPTKLIVGTCRIWRGGNTGASWPGLSTKNALSHKFNSALDTTCGNDSTDVPVASIAAGGPKTTAGSKVIYTGLAGGPSTVYMTKNAGAPGTAPTAWTDVTSTINPNGYAVAGLAVDPHDATGATVLAGIQGFTGGPGKVWRSTNFGTSWTDITNDLPDVPVNDVAIDPDDANVVYVATDIGVFVTSGFATWTEVGPNTVGATGFLPNTTVFHVAIFKNGTEKRLRAWTHGRGAWETILSGASGVTASPTSLSFTAEATVTSSVQTATLTNNDAVLVTLGTPSLSGANASSFAIDPASTTCGATLDAGLTCNLGFTFTPAAAGSFSASASLTTTGTGTPTVNVPLIGTGTPSGVTPNPTSLTFASQENQKSAAQSVTLTNNDAVAVTLGTAILGGTNPGQFALDTASTTCGTSLAAGAACKVGFTFTPNATASFSATASITTTGVGTPTVVISFTGTGTTPTATSFTYDFGTNPTSVTVTAGTSATYNFNINTTPADANFSTALTFACSGLPSKTACTFSPTSLTTTGAVALTISTTASTSAEPGKQQANTFGGALAVSLALPGIAFLVPGFTSKSRRKRMLLYLGMMLIVIAFVGMSACGGGGNGSGGGGVTHIPGTPAGSYTVHITGTSGSVTATQDVTLVVQ
ncbi:hypothetical protein Acid345_2318 [Candidatus Koribacter versatilis Ellin345]|uniref:Choice-of-anchor D domain-containing protein n=1 Tax=Koribacter versatilis (strain Ellin345) TaxID=204669 RepID=Q1IP81_KORVE|nr:choice-of-anchor D domain-containing protein [Candidatus Koribacter versatilis]ABF41319.1 hypothetical protein Acid345_2318 [Candidatus Koribacter versatilis Ellin345]